MNPDIENLVEIQDIDKEVLKLRRELERYENSREPRLAEVKRIEEKIEGLKTEIQELEKRVRESDRQVAGWRESLRKFLAQQSQVKTQKEYDALNHEMSEGEEKISKADEKGLEFLEKEEKLVARLEALEKDLAVRRRECETELARIDERQADRKSLIESLGERRKAMVSRLDPEVLHRYEQLQAQFPGTAVVPVQDGNCGGCFMKLILHRIQVSGRGQGELVECTSCHRFLYTPASEMESEPS